MANFSFSPSLFWVILFASLNGVMAEMDSDLIGVVVAAVCIGILSIVIIAFMAYCCFRRIEYDRKSSLLRKNSDSVSTGIAPRWAPNMTPASRPVYSVPAEPVMYAVPANYYLGHYAPKFIDAEQLHYMRPYQYAQFGGEEIDEEEYKRRAQEYQEYLSQRDAQLRQRDEQRHVQQQTDVTTVTQTETTATTATTATTETAETAETAEQQPNGQASGEFSASSVNYKVIRRQHKHEKMPEWLRKDYDENEKSMDVEDDDVSRGSSAGQTPASPDSKGTPLTAVRAQVSPKNSVVNSDDLLHVSRDFTIVDYVDPERRPIPSGSYAVEEDTSQGYRITTHTYTATLNATDYANTTTTTAAFQRAKDTSHASVSTYVPPASTSTPRAPPPPPPEVMEDVDAEHYRMRKKGEGSVSYLPAQSSDIKF